MRRVTENEAIRLIQSGITLKCKVSKDTFQPVKSLLDLNNLKNLAAAKVQSFELYEDSEISLPENAVKISVDEAFGLLSIMHIVYCLTSGEEKEVLSTAELANLIRQLKIRGENFVLYRK